MKSESGRINQMSGGGRKEISVSPLKVILQGHPFIIKHNIHMIKLFIHHLILS